MSYADYSRHRPEIVTCRRCGWTGEEGGDCDCDAMDAKLQAEQANGEEFEDGQAR